MELVRNFKKLSKNDAGLAGGKGASLGEMTQAGIPVPPGFVVLSESFEQFIKETDLAQEIDAILHTVDHKEIHLVEKASEKIRALILSREMPKDIADAIGKSFKELDTKYVAVRSSATAEDGMDHAWAGQLESYLNTTEDQVLTKVKLCWSSLFTPRAIFYRFEKLLHSTKISVAVVVQKMVESEVSGIAFSVHPVTEDYNQLIIEAGFGLGEAIVSGSVTPDSYVVEKNPRNILDINISTQERGLYKSETHSAEHGNNEWRDIPEPKASSQVLTKEQILELSEIILGIEKHYGFPCDIEWAFEKGKFYIVQSRPITTLAKKTDHSAEVSKSLFQSPELADFNPDDYKFLGLWKNDLFATCFWQDCWIPELVAELGLKSTGLRVANLSGGNFLVSKSEINNIYDQVSKKIEEKDEKYFKNMIEVADRQFTEGLKIGKSLKSAEPTPQNFLTFVLTAKKINLIWLLGASHLSAIAEKKLQETVAAESFPAEHVLDIIPKVVTPMTSLHSDLALLKKSIGDRTFDEIKKDEFLNSKLEEMAAKYSWIEIMNFVGSPMTPERLFEQMSHMSEGEENHEYVPEKPLSSDLVQRAKFLNYCGYLKQAGAEYFSIFSESVLSFLNSVASKIGVTYREFVTLSTMEIEKALKGEITSRDLKKFSEARMNKNEWFLLGGENGSIIFIENPSDIKLLNEKMIPRADKDSKEIKGEIGNPGKYTGPVRIIMNTHDFSKMQPGDVLVSTMTTPDFVILMQKSGAIVTDIGGMLCHAAIVSREINKPCIIGTRFATQILKDGDVVEVDADKGIVKIL